MKIDNVIWDVVEELFISIIGSVTMKGPSIVITLLALTTQLCGQLSEARTVHESRTLIYSNVKETKYLYHIALV